MEDAKKSKGRTCFIIDDGTGALNFYAQDALTRLITTCRHIKLTLWMILHASNGQIKPSIRTNIKYLFLTNYENEKAFKNLYEEYVSMYNDDYKTFKLKYIDSMNEKYGQILIARNSSIKNDDGGGKSLVDYNVKSWNLLNEKENLTKIQVKPKAIVEAIVKEKLPVKAIAKEKLPVKAISQTKNKILSGKVYF